MWPSGRRRSPAKGVGGKPSRGFESLRLRQDTHSSVFAMKIRCFMCGVGLPTTYAYHPRQPPMHSISCAIPQTTFAGERLRPLGQTTSVRASLPYPVFAHDLMEQGQTCGSVSTTISVVGHRSGRAKTMRVDTMLPFTPQPLHRAA